MTLWAAWGGLGRPLRPARHRRTASRGLIRGPCAPKWQFAAVKNAPLDRVASFCTWQHIGSPSSVPQAEIEEQHDREHR